MDAANLLKPALARGELRCIGATTLDEFREHIEKDPALERRFQPVFVGEPSVEDTIAILRGLKERYEVHHKVKIKDSALVTAAKLASRYITDRFLPDKAIDLVDEAAQPAVDGAPVGPDRDRRPPAPAAPAPVGRADARAARRRSTPASGWPRSRSRSSRSRSSSRTSAASGRWRNPGLGDIQKVRERLEAVKIRVQPGLGRDPPHAAARRAARGEAVPGPGRPRRRAQGPGEADRRGRGHGRRAGPRAAGTGCSRKRSTPRRSPRSSASGPASPSPRCSRPSARSS